MPRIDREAVPATTVAAVPAALALLLGRPRVAAVLGVLPLAVAAFFRDPDRTPDQRPVPADDVLAPADGKVMYAGAGQDGVAPEGEWQQVSIFLSAFDVHINRAPYGGRVTEVVQRPGKWLAAYTHESAHLNERADITVEREVEGEVRRVHFRQIVGLMARRVVTRVAVGDELATGERVGLMKFGSRMDVFVPPRVRPPRLGRGAGRRRRDRHRPLDPPLDGEVVTTPAAPGRRRILARWRLVSPTGARVVSLRQLPKRERARLLAPSAFTTLNMVSGLSSVLLAFRGHFTARGLPHRRLDRPRHRRRVRRPAHRRDLALRPAARLARRPHLLRPGPGDPRAHLGPRRVAGARLAGRLLLAGLRGVPPGPVQRDDRPPRRQALLRRPALAGRRRRRHGDDPRPRLPALGARHRARGGPGSRSSSASSRRSSWS